MKGWIFLFCGLFLSLAAISGNQFGHSSEEPSTMVSEEMQQAIISDMEQKFQVRDTFKEKGNSGKYLKTYSEASLLFK